LSFVATGTLDISYCYHFLLSLPKEQIKYQLSQTKKTYLQFLSAVNVTGLPLPTIVEPKKVIMTRP
jgi:hypothetical protein